MNLVVFDIDGTILNSVKVDDACFVQTFDELYQIDLSGEIWNRYEHVTDSGITYELFKHKLGRKPSKEDLEKITDHYYQLLKLNSHQISEIRGAIEFLEKLKENDNFRVAFATGGWKKTAILKCESIKFDVTEYILKTASDHYNRSEIIRLAIDDVMRMNDISKFRTITYIGDGLWDYKATRLLNINFIGMDYSNNKILRKAGARHVIRDYSDMDRISKLINSFSISGYL